MVQVFGASPAAMQRGDIGRAIGVGVNRNFPDPQQLVQKKQLSDAFQSFQKNSMNPNASPLDLTMSFLQATAGIPGSERYVGQVLPMILNQANAQRGANTPPPGADVPPPANKPASQQPQQRAVTGTPTQQFYQKTQQEIPNFPEPEVEQPNIFSGSLEPTQLGMGPLPRTYSPEQIQRLETEDMQAGFPQSIRAERAKQYNDLARKDLQDYVTAAQTQSVLSQQRRESQEQFRGTLQSFFGKDPLTLSLAENIANKPEYQNIANDQLRAEKVKREVDLVSRNLEGYKNASSRPNPYMPWSRYQYQKNFDALRQNAAPLIKEGLRPELHKVLTDNGWSTTESEQILNPLGGQIISETKTLPDVGVSDVRSAGGGQAFKEQDVKRIEQGNKKWSNFFEKTIKPGKTDPRTRDTIQPGTSLVLLRNEYMKKGGNWQDFESMIQDLRAKGKIKFDKFQENEMNIINQRPAQSWTIEEFMFGTKSL